MNLLEIKQLSQDVFVLCDKKLGFHNNIVVIFTQNGPIIIDVFRDKDQFDEVISFLKSKGFEEPNTIIYTHWHTDHTCGNRSFENCRVIAHEATYRHLEDFIEKDLERLIDKGILEKNIKIVMPTETFKEELTLEIGEKELKLLHCPGHSYDSILINDMTDNILIAGDNLVGSEVDFCMPPVIPPDEIDAKAKDLERAYKMLEEINAGIIVPGHGEVIEADKIIESNKQRYNKCLKEDLKFIEL